MKRENNRIRTRKSYAFFKELHHFMEEGKTAELFKRVYELMDRYKAFGSYTLSAYYKESMDQVINDINNKTI